jgi:hypothetical protein
MIEEWTSKRYTGAQAMGGRLNTQYATLNATGPVYGNLFYGAWFTYGSGRTLTWLEDTNSVTGFSYQYVPISAVMSGLSLDLYMPEKLGSAANLRFIFASGDKDWTSVTEGNTAGDANQFIPLTATSLGTVFSPALSNLIVTELGGSMRPFSAVPVQTGLRLMGFFRPTEGPVDASGLQTGETSSWLGFETDLYANYRIMSDMGLSLNGGLFFPGISPNGAFSVGTQAVWFAIDAAFVLEF